MGEVTAVACAGFDAATDSSIASARADLLKADGRLRASANRPHVTLSAAKVDAGAELDRLVAVVAQLAGTHAPFPLILDRLSSFRRPGVLWLGPAASSDLSGLQRDVATSLIEAGWAPAFGAQSDPQHWVPHCTIARNARRVPVLEFRPIAARVDRLVVILVGRGELTCVRLAG